MDITVLPTHRLHQPGHPQAGTLAPRSLAGGLLYTGFFFAGRAPDSLVSRNYDSVALARQMSRLWPAGVSRNSMSGRTALPGRPSLSPGRRAANVTETGEQAAVDAVARSWSELLLAGPEDADMSYNHVRMQLNALVALNEEGIRQRIAEGRWWRDFVFTAGVALFLACTLWARKTGAIRRALPIPCAARRVFPGPSAPA